MVSTIESLSGTGLVHIGDRPMGSVTYRLAVQQDMIGTGNRLGGLMSVAGRLSGDFKVIFELLHNPNAVVLTIEGGRKLRVIVQGDGSFEADGYFY